MSRSRVTAGPAASSGTRHGRDGSLITTTLAALEQAGCGPLRPAGTGDGIAAPDIWPGAREQATRFALACRPTLPFGQTLECSLSVRPPRTAGGAASSSEESAFVAEVAP